MTDGELVRHARRGDRTACESLVHRWSARVLAVCHSRVINRHVAEELAQESLLRGVRALPSLEDPEKFGPWLCGIATRVCLDWHKAKQSSQIPFTALTTNGSPDELATSCAESVEMQFERAEELKRLMSEVEALPETHRETLMLFYYQELSYRQIAETLEVSTATVNARLTQARTMLRERLRCKAR
jgi:RNA polymerase sigma-70 factor (ECF subfamily)